MKGDYLDHKLECETCGTIYLNIPKGAGERTPIHCSTCDRYLGTWGELQNDFLAQTRNGNGTFELKDGRVREN